MPDASAGPSATGDREPSERKPSERKQEVMLVARKLFAERGIRGATVRGIGASVGLLSGSLYHHFGSKDDLVDQILREFTESVLRSYDEIMTQSGDTASTLRAMTRYAFSLVQTAPEEMAMVRDEYLYEPSPDGTSRFAYVVDFNARVGKHWFDTLETGLASGELRDTISPRLLYRLIRDAIIGATRWWVPQRGVSTDDIADALIDVVLRGIVVRDSATAV